MSEKAESAFDRRLRKNREANVAALPYIKTTLKIAGAAFTAFTVCTYFCGRSPPDSSTNYKTNHNRSASELQTHLSTPAGVRAYADGGILRGKQLGWDAEKCFPEVCRGHDSWCVSDLQLCENMVTAALDRS